MKTYHCGACGHTWREGPAEHPTMTCPACGDVDTYESFLNDTKGNAMTDLHYLLSSPIMEENHVVMAEFLRIHGRAIIKALALAHAVEVASRPLPLMGGEPTNVWVAASRELKGALIDLGFDG